MACTSPTNGRSRSGSTVGFTLLEAMLAVVISGIVFAGVLSAYIFLARGLVRQGNEEEMESASRVALYYLSQDVATATTLDPANVTATSLSLYAPDSGDEITYTYTPPVGTTLGTLVRTTTGSVPGPTPLTILHNLTAFSFNFYSFVPVMTTTPPPIPPAVAIKQVNMSYSCQSGVAASGAQSNLVVNSPRISLKNKVLLGAFPGLQ